MIKFTTQNRMPRAWKITPIETIRFQISQPRLGIVGVNAARHAQKSGNVHEVKGQMKADDEQPEMPLTQAFVQHLPVALGNQ